MSKIALLAALAVRMVVFPVVAGTNEVLGKLAFM
jgi:hypothetical protein